MAFQYKGGGEGVLKLKMKTRSGDHTSVVSLNVHLKIQGAHRTNISYFLNSA